MNQENIALGIVALVFVGFIYKFIRLYVAARLAQYLLNCGFIKFSMWMRKRSSSPSCSSGCSSCKL